MINPAQPDWRRDRPWLARATVCDGLLPWTEAFLPAGASLAEQLQRFRAAGIDHVSVTVAAGNDTMADAMVRIGQLRRQLAGCAQWLQIASGAEPIAAAREAGKMSVSWHFQTATPFNESLDLVDAFRAAGVDRAILAYNESNMFADGCHEARNAGLSAVGRRLIARMDRAGMRVDLSHCSERTSLDALEADLSRAPVFSHSNARALFDHERNLSDGQIRACGARGGYIGISGVGMFLGVQAAQIPHAMAEHAAHIAGLIGAGRVGLGLDFMYLQGSDYGFYTGARARWPRGYPSPPWDFLQPEQFGDLVRALEARGFDHAELAGILGGNYLALAA